jgi:hypothetical protein
MSLVALSEVDEATPPKRRARITNDPGIYPGIPEGSAKGRRYRDLVSAYIQDLGGIDLVSESKLGVLRELARIRVEAEQLGANGADISVAERCTMSSTILRLSVRLGFERVAKPIEPLQDRLRWLAEHPTPLPTVEEPEPGLEDASQDHD